MSQESEKELSLLVCTWRSCRERQSEYILKRLGNDLCSIKESIDIDISPTLCRGRCKEGPILVEHYDNEVQIEHTYSNPIKASKIFKHLLTQLWQKKSKSV
jgi:NADH:ubiquinone oxidoreductase subunit E